MKLKRKELWLFAAPLLVMGSVAAVSAWSNRCTDSCYSFIGNVNSDVSGTQAALQQLSQQIKRCPDSSLYTAHYEVVAKGVRVDDVNLKYEPATGILVYEPDYSAEIQLWRNVKVPGIHAVAQSGKLTNLKQHGSYRTR